MAPRPQTPQKAGQTTSGQAAGSTAIPFKGQRLSHGAAALAHNPAAADNRVFSNLKRWALGTFHGLRRPHLRRYLDEFVFRWNRRRHTATAFDALLGIGTRLQPAGYRDIVG